MTAVLPDDRAVFLSAFVIVTLVFNSKIRSTLKQVKVGKTLVYSFTFL